MNVLWHLDPRNYAMKTFIRKFILDCKCLSNDDGLARGTVFEEIRQGAGFINRIFR